MKKIDSKNINKWDIWDFMICDGEKCIIKFLITPIRRNSYVIYLFENNNKYYIKYVCCREIEYLDYIRKAIDDKVVDSNINLETFLKFYKDSKYQREFEDKFLQRNNNIDQIFIRKEIEKIKKLDFKNHNKPVQNGLDGYHVEAEIFKNDFYSWLNCSELYYIDVIELVNYFLDLLEVDKKYRFKIEL